MPRDNGCCGFDFGKERVTMTGLLTFSLPILGICLFFWPAAVIAGRLLPRTRDAVHMFEVFMKANLHLIRSAAVYPKIRCAIAGKVFSYSPGLSGFLYRYFNVFVLGVLEAGIIAGIVYITRSFRA